MGGVVFAAGFENEDTGPLSGGRLCASGTGGPDGGALGTSGRADINGGIRFDDPIGAGGYAWFYVDALSDDGKHGLTIIAFIGSVFSPYYAWSGWGDPVNHCAVNVALYGPRGHLWSMTERRRNVVNRECSELAIGPSRLSWERSGLTIAIDEVTAPIPSRLRGTVRVIPTGLNPRSFVLDAHGRHVWRPVAPCARVEADFVRPTLSWTGDGYLDMNTGIEPLEFGFHDWTWSRAHLRTGATILYDANRTDHGPLSLALRFKTSGECEAIPPLPQAPLPKTLWRLGRETRSDDATASELRRFEDAPFYSRSLISSRLFGERAVCVHEVLSLRRFRQPLVKLMLPFRMPRR
jgi:carotenoid 1,2-hydratase